MKGTLATSALAVGLYAALSTAQSCANVLVPSYKAPVVASGWQAQIVASGLRKPRSIEFDSAGGLLVVDAGRGLFRLTFKDNGGTCLQVDQQTLVVNNTGLNHGLALSTDGRTLYASTVESVLRWSYDAQSGKVSGEPQTVITGMRNNDLTTRTLLMSKKENGMLLVSRGSSADFDTLALSVDTGISQVRAFDMTRIGSDTQPYQFSTSGRRMGWGLRNSVGLGEHPITGGIYSMDNSVDGITRGGRDVSTYNPGEELNFHGYLNGLTENQGNNYGYPTCFAVWNSSTIPDGGSLRVGNQFGINSNSSNNDAACNSANYTSPRLTFPAHYAPMDIKFSPDGATAYVSFRGSLSKANPVGYRVATVAFDPVRGEPLAPPDSASALTDLISNPEGSSCPDSCMRPVGINRDARGRLWVTADSTGEIYVLERQAGTPTAGAPGVMVTKASAAAGGAWGSGRDRALCYAAAGVAGVMALVL